jgi:methionyl-tRNA formyltransferase
MKIVFMGTPTFAVPSLKLLQQSQHTIVGIVTTPDKPAGRGKKIMSSAVKAYAEENNLPLLQPTFFKDKNFINSLASWNADLFLVVAFKILPKEVFEIPPKGTANLHASLLPKYRGAAPINWALMNGETDSGVTTFFIEKKVDTGEILLQEKVQLLKDMTAGDLHDILADVGAKILVETADRIKEGNLVPQKQDGNVTLAPKLTKELGQINWDRSAQELHNLIRGLSPVPSAYSNFSGSYVKILRSSLTIDLSLPKNKSGQVVSVPKNGPIKVQTGNGILDILEIQPQGKKAQTAGEFIRGYRVKEGDRFGDARLDQ